MTDLLEKNVETVNELMEKSTRAAAIFSEFSQEQTDRIVRAVLLAGLNNRVRLAKMAHEETGIGNWQDKVVKNFIGTKLVYDDIKNLKTVGIISEDFVNGITEIAVPLGPILAITPVTNPTSTVLFKILIAMKTRNPIIISPHSKAVKCSTEAARICYEAALEADAPEDCIQWIEHSSRELTQSLMRNSKLALIIATGGSGLVKEAYSSGTPALGVGAGNVPVFIEKSADIPFAVKQIIISKTFDNGTVCCSEQFLVVEKSIKEEVMAEFKKQNAYFLNDDEITKLQKVAYDEKRNLMNADIVGRSATVIAKMAGINVPDETKLLIAPLLGVGKEYPLSNEILAPILAYCVAENFESAVNVCIKLNFFGGMGHSVSIFSNDDEKIKKFALLMNAGRIVVNSPSSPGGVGGMYNKLLTSLTLGCGASGHNITTDNVSAKHLINIQRVARRRVNERMTKLNQTPELYFDENITGEMLEKEYDKNY